MIIFHQPHESGASEVVGEMLMIGLVIILISVFASVLGNFIPSAHDPNITIRVTNDTQGNITLWHKGGDWVKAEDLRIIVGDDHTRKNFVYNKTITNTVTQFQMVPAKDTFDLGSNITVISGITLTGDDTINLATSRATIFSGKVLP